MKVFDSRVWAIVMLTACGGGSANLTAGAMPPGRTFQGVWQSPQYGNMHVCVTGAQVVGDFEKDERRGTIQGTVQGDLMRFQWEEQRELVVGRPTTSRGRGYFRLIIDENDDSRMVGEWGLDEAQAGQPWDAVRMRNRRPDRCLGGGSRDDQNNPSGVSDGYAEDYGDDGYNAGGNDDLNGLDEL